MALTYPLDKWKTWQKIPGTTAHKKWDRLVDTYGELASEVLRRIVLKDGASFVYARSSVPPVDDCEVVVLLTAKHFTTVRRVERAAPKEVRTFERFSQAVADVAGDPTVIVYGVVTDINSTSLPPKYWKFYTAILAAVAERG